MKSWEQWDELLGCIQDAALDPGAWPAAIERTTELLGARSAEMTLLNLPAVQAAGLRVLVGVAVAANTTDRHLSERHVHRRQSGGLYGTGSMPRRWHLQPEHRRVLEPEQGGWLGV